MTITFTVFGVPQSKGSARAFIPKGWTRPIITSTNKSLKAWEQLVRAEASAELRRCGGVQMVGPVVARVACFLPRPKSLPKRVLHNVKRPDIDKVVRGIFDSLTGVIWKDDSQVVNLVASKRYADPGESPCVVVLVREVVT